MREAQVDRAITRYTLGPVDRCRLHDRERSIAGSKRSVSETRVHAPSSPNPSPSPSTSQKAKRAWNCEDAQHEGSVAELTPKPRP